MSRAFSFQEMLTIEPISGNSCLRSSILVQIEKAAVAARCNLQLMHDEFYGLSPLSYIPLTEIVFSCMFSRGIHFIKNHLTMYWY